ncbi:hypothetical protein [Flavobacterium limi]|uniref:TLDc domain-containing protein n=1 Tax=Flavobacterium limi TaxID=2045105 RepID=A0ABQ1US67_9FLAO|nr:hypothetical protein [Flavobacterium limi]GGF23845.1 hypothetical protein GCM10011518_36400 [Flavobacterium limi]
MIIDLSFQSNYSLELLEKLGTDNRYYYPGDASCGGKDGLIVKVIPSQGESWIGVFSFGEISYKGLCGVYTTPNPDKFCVISRGSGYIVSSFNPNDWNEVQSIPIMDVRSIKSQNIIVFADFTDLIGYDKNGIKWHERVANDGFKITEITDTYLRGEFWDIRNETNTTFEVDLLSGTLEKQE